jgi:hypothetical protein
VSTIRMYASWTSAVADGKEVAGSIGQLLARQSVTGPQKAFSVRMGRVAGDELSELLAAASKAPRQDAADRLQPGRGRPAGRPMPPLRLPRLGDLQAQALRGHLRRRSEPLPM